METNFDKTDKTDKTNEANEANEAKGTDVFCCAQLTSAARDTVGDNSYVAATPAFNLRPITPDKKRDSEEMIAHKKTLAARWDPSNFVSAPAFGVKINEAVYEMLQQLTETAIKTGDSLPMYKWNIKVASCLDRCDHLVAMAREAGHHEWATNVEHFLTRMKALKPEDITSFEVWRGILKEAGAKDDYTDNLHYTRMWRLFDGITEEEMIALLRRGYKDRHGNDVAGFTGENVFSNTNRLINNHLRWLSNAFKMWDLEGSQADVVNLTMALLGRGVGTNAPISEGEVLDALKELTQRLKDKNFEGLRCFNRIVSDFERDDRTADILLRHIASALGYNVDLYVLLPPNKQHRVGKNRDGTPLMVELNFDPLRIFATETLGAIVVEDSESRNAEALDRQNNGLRVV